MAEGYIALGALVALVVVVLVRWADAQYQDARRAQRERELDSVRSAE